MLLFSYDVIALDPAFEIRNVKIPCYLFVGSKDTNTPPEKIKQMYINCQGNPKQFKVIHGGHNDSRGFKDLANGIEFIMKILDAGRQGATHQSNLNSNIILRRNNNQSLGCFGGGDNKGLFGCFN